MVFGNGVLARLGELTGRHGGQKCLLVTDPGIVAAGHVARAVASLEQEGVHTVVFDGVLENPTTVEVTAGLAIARAESVDFLVGLGGGSSLDCAKGINFLFSCGGEIRDYWGVGKATSEMLPMIAIPTTAGTGSENQSFALISDPQTHQKMACGDKKAACRVALLDPELTVSQPPRVAAATGIDALSHAVESYVTTKRNPLSQAFARQAWSLLCSSFERIIDVPEDLEARGRMLLGASLAGMAIENSMLGAAHSAANPLTARFDVVHGNAVGLLLSHVVRYNQREVGSEYAELARVAGETCDAANGGEALAAIIERLLEKSGLPGTLTAYGVSEADIPSLAEGATAQWTAQFNPREMTHGEFETIYRCAL
jgi:alcohol dehydrogenase